MSLGRDSTEERIQQLFARIQVLDVDSDLEEQQLLRLVEKDLEPFPVSVIHLRMIGHGVKLLEAMQYKQAIPVLEHPLRTLEHQRREELWYDSQLIKICKRILPSKWLNLLQEELNKLPLSLIHI